MPPEAAAATPPPAPAATPPPATPPPAAGGHADGSAGTHLTSVPAGDHWSKGFENPELGKVVETFKSPEALAASYKELRAKLSSQPGKDKMVAIPEKFDGPDGRAFFEKIGMPKEAKDYKLGEGKKVVDEKFQNSMADIFHKAGLSTAQAKSLSDGYDALVEAGNATAVAAARDAIKVGDAALRKEWAGDYEKNFNIAKQGAKIYGLSKETIDAIEARQGREFCFKFLQKLGVNVSESNFIDGKPAPAPKEMTQAEAQEELKKLIQDPKFAKKIDKGDREARAHWDKVNQLAAPGTVQIL